MSIACLLSITALSQNDTTYIFNKAQVKEFLYTKVLLNNCNDQYNIIKVENKAISDTLTVVTSDNTKLQKKLKRNRQIAIGGISAFILAVVLLFAI